MLSTIFEFIKALPALLAVFKQVHSFLIDLENKKIEDEKLNREKAIEDLKKANTPEQVWKANDEITKNLP